jgi:hypothetical protein
MSGPEGVPTKAPDQPSEAPEAAASKSPAAPRKAAASSLVAFTLDPDTGEIVKVEGVDRAGKRHDLSAEERASLVAGEPRTIETVLEQAFEAGIACVLGDEAADDEDDAGETEAEADGDADLRRLLLRPLMAHSPAKRLMERALLGHAILGTLIQQANGASAGADGGAN